MELVEGGAPRGGVCRRHVEVWLFSVRLERASNMSACTVVVFFEVIQKGIIAFISVKLGQLLATKIYRYDWYR